MIGVESLGICLVTSSVLIIFGLAPNLFEMLIEGILNFQRTFGNRGQFPRRGIRVEQPVWMAWLGFGFLLFGLLAYFTK